MIAWLYRYIFRGIGILFAFGMITIFLISVASQMRKQAEIRQTAPRPAAKVSTAP